MLSTSPYGGMAQSLLETAKTPTITKTDDDSRLREQTNAFEALIVKYMLDIALKTDDGLLPKAAGHDIYHAMYKETLSETLAGGFGYSDLLFDFLKEEQMRAGGEIPKDNTPKIGDSKINKDSIESKMPLEQNISQNANLNLDSMQNEPKFAAQNTIKSAIDLFTKNENDNQKEIIV